MTELNIPRKSSYAPFAPSLQSSLRNSPHFKALCEFLLATRRGQARQLLITAIVALTLVLPAAALILSNGLGTASSNLKQARVISVFMSPNTEQSTAEELAGMLATNSRIANTRLLELANPDLTTSSGITLLEVIPTNSLDSEEIVALADNLSALAGIDFVELNLARLIENQSAFNLLTLAARLSAAVSLLVAAVMVWLVCRHDISGNKPNIKLLQQLGGTDQDIRRPFLYRGPAVGLLAAALGITVAMLLLWFVKTKVDISTYSSLISIKPTWIQAFAFAFIAITVSLLTTLRLFSKIFTHYNQ